MKMKQTLKRTLLVLVAISATTLTPLKVAAQELLEEIVVTGIRASMQDSIATKRNSDTIVDAISMEDIGKFPDENVAEALQRVPGAAIDRNKGEGRFITIRGLGPDLVKVTVNGQTAPGDSDVNIFSDTVAKGGRAFSFDQLQFDDSSLFFLNQLRDEPVFATDEEFQVRFNAQRDLSGGFFDQVQFGIEYRDRNKFRDRDRLVVSSANFGGPATNPLTLLPTNTLPSDFLSDLPVLSPLASGSFPNVAAAFDLYLNQRRDEIPQSVFDGAEFPQGDFEIDEETLAFYLQGNFTGSFGDTPVRGNIGVRAVRTEQASTGFESPILDVDIANGNVIFGSPTSITVEQGYWNILPSVNVVFDVSDDVLIRFAAGKTIARPILEELSPGTISANGSLPSVTNGNPNLDPFEAINVDLTAEWYFDEDAILSAAIFWKDIDSFIFNQTRIENVTLPDGTLAQDPFSRLPIELNVVAPQNGPGGQISGFELALQDQFDWLPSPFDGFGVQLNYTYVDTTASFTNEALGLSFGAPGLSENTLNAAVFYEKGPVSIRAAFNRRDEFLELVAGLQTNPEFVEEFSTVDLSASYYVNDTLTFTFEGINLNNEKLSKFSAIPERLRLLDETGRRFFFGVRAVF